MTGVTTIGMNYDVRPGMDETFLASFGNVLARIRTMPDHVDSRLYRDIDEPRKFLVNFPAPLVYFRGR